MNVDREGVEEGWGRVADAGEGCLEYMICSLFWHPRSVFVLLTHFMTLGVAPPEPVSSIKSGDFSSPLLSHFLEIPSHKQKLGLAEAF